MTAHSRDVRMFTIRADSITNLCAVRCFKRITTVSRANPAVGRALRSRRVVTGGEETQRGSRWLLSQGLRQLCCTAHTVCTTTRTLSQLESGLSGAQGQTPRISHFLSRARPVSPRPGSGGDARYLGHRMCDVGCTQDIVHFHSITPPSRDNQGRARMTIGRGARLREK
jgi:hypothetical protein